MNCLRDTIIKNYKEEYYDNAKVVLYNDFKNTGLKYFTFDELNNISENVFPLCCFKDELNDKLIYGMSNKVTHTYVEGETGAGKTTRIIMQSVNALSNLGKKASMLVLDPYGEIFENTFLQLKKEGYNVKILNCDNPSKSDTYNPFYNIAKQVIEEQEISSGVLNQIRKIAEVMVPPDQTPNDPIWDQGACSYLNGLIIDAFEDLLNGDLSIDEINIYNIIQRHYWLRSELYNFQERNIFRIPHYQKKGNGNIGAQKMMSVTNNAEKTRDSYFGVVENGLDKFGQIQIYKLSSNCNIDLECFIEKPTVIFIQSGETKIADHLVSLLVSDLYNLCVKLGKQSSTKSLSRQIHLFLDEFANYSFGTGDEYIKMLTTSRKFGLHWHMFLQCDAQLDKKYNNTYIGDIIRANATEIFMGSLDYKTLERFAYSCGMQTVESLNSKLYRNNVELQTINLITPNKLSLTKPGYVYIKLNKCPLLLSYFEPFYTCSEFKKVYDIAAIYPNNCFNYLATKKVPSDYNEKKEYTCDNNMSQSSDESLYYLRDNLKWVKINDEDKLLVVDIDYETLKKLNINDIDTIAISDLNQSYCPIETKKINEIDALNEELNVKINKTTNLKDFKKKLNKFSLIPDIILEKIFENKDVDIPSLKVLKFEIIENFISKHNYQTKDGWIKNFKEEFKYIKKLDLLTPLCYQEIQDALDDFNDLTIENILEIKKIIEEQI